MGKNAGVLSTVVAAFMFGLTAAFGKMSFELGNNPVMLTVLRGLFAIPVLLIILKWQKIPIALSRLELRIVLFIGLLSSPAPICLYSTFKYLPVGTGTALQFTFPVIVAVVSALLHKKRPHLLTIGALVLSMIGVSLFYDGSSSDSIAGFVFAIATAITYSSYILGVGLTRLRDIHFLKISFYFSIIWTIVAIVYATLTQQITFDIKPLGLFYSFVVSMLVVVVGYSLFQLGIKLSGATTASVLATVEPITANIAGMIILGESLSLKSAIAAIIIIVGVILAALGVAKERQQQENNA